jgi:hypothetical protein
VGEDHLCFFSAPIKRHLVKRKSYPLKRQQNFVSHLRIERDLLSDKARGRHLHHCRLFYRFGFQQAMLYCTMHPSGSRGSIFIALVKMSRGSESQRSHGPCSLLVFTSHPCPLLRTQKMTGSRPCPKVRDNSHGCGGQHFDGSRRGQSRWKSRIHRGGTGRQSTLMVWPAKNRVSHSSPLLKRTFSPPGNRHDLS